MILVKLPLPPSLNNSYVNSPKGRFKSADARAWAQHAALILKLKMAGLPKVSGPWAALIALPQKMPGDCDNRVKPLLDALVASGRVSDDRHSAGHIVWRDHGVAADECRIAVFPASVASLGAVGGPTPSPFPSAARAEAAL